MARFLIEVPHDADKSACTKAVHAFLRTGSHFLTRADWGCKDGEHKAWIVMEVDTKDEALSVVPAYLRSGARAIKLNLFTLEDIKELKEYHDG